MTRRHIAWGMGSKMPFGLEAMAGHGHAPYQRRRIVPCRRLDSVPGFMDQYIVTTVSREAVW